MAQYSSDGGATWSSPQAMTSQAITFTALPPAKTYLFRCYAVNEMGNGAAVTAPQLFVPAGGSIRVGGAWATASNTFVRVGGVWVPAQNVKPRVAGAWVNAN